ncbi:MAG: hypothetical protein L0216_09180 [Planctomycetales bacterium]|nr:hypothetical protein [Planctomycetales bacterium]
MVSMVDAAGGDERTERIRGAPRPHCGRGFASDLATRRTGDGRIEAVVRFEGGCEGCFKNFLEWPLERQHQVLFGSGHGPIVRIARDDREPLLALYLCATPKPAP